ncbi:hypothetical protein HCN44_001540 [Aphidius gifuensis]|uniref:Uncharacterized protein n=1 Tax=Aphidius gifuensis TaxID=684658 RepID=A0A834XUC7_APHGI|nr:hypothetical protein HCN44_001540 [Aphidius gifuensis]
MASKSTSLSPRNSEVHALEERGYIIGKKIGEQGSYATVHQAEYYCNDRSKKIQLACKIYDKEKAPFDYVEKFFPRELEIPTKVENPFTKNSAKYYFNYFHFNCLNTTKY